MRRRRERTKIPVLFWVGMCGFFLFLGFYTPAPQIVSIQQDISLDSK